MARLAFSPSLLVATTMVGASAPFSITGRPGAGDMPSCAMSVLLSMTNHSSAIWFASLNVTEWNSSWPIFLPLGGTSPIGVGIAPVLVPVVSHTAAMVRPFTSTSCAVLLASGKPARNTNASSTILSPPRRSGIGLSGQWLTASLA